MGHMLKLYFSVYPEKEQHLPEYKLKRGISCLCIFYKCFGIPREDLYRPGRAVLTNLDS